MFFCCCPRKKKHKQIEQLQQSLMVQQSNKSQLTLRLTIQQKLINDQQYIKKIQRKINSDVKSQPEQQRQKDMSKLYERLHKTEVKPTVQTLGIPPSFQKTESLKLLSPRQKFIVPTKKSHLWKQQLKADLIYLDSSSSEYIYMSYRLAKNLQSKQCLNGLDYFLSKSQDKIHIIVGKQSMFSSKLTTINKYMHNIINVVIVNQGIVSIPDQNMGSIQVILMENVRNLRWNGINSLVIMADSLHTFAQVKEYFSGVVHNLRWDQLKKTTFLFPSFMTLEQISKLLFSCIKQFFINSTIQKASLDLVLELQLIQGTNLDSCIVIKFRTQDVKQANSVYDHLKLSIVFFAKQLMQLNQKLYIDFYVQIRQKTLQQYCDMKEFYRRNPMQFRHKVKEIRDIDPKVFADLESSSPLKQIPTQESGYYYVIPNKVREDIGRIYNIAQLQKKQVDTPVKKQWDDDATADDFKTSKTSKLDLIAKQELDQIDLQMGFGYLSDEDMDIKPEQSSQNQITLKFQQNQAFELKKMQNQNKTYSPSLSNKRQKIFTTKQFPTQNRCDRNHRYQRYQ